MLKPLRKITKNIAINAKYGDIFWHTHLQNKDHSPVRCRVNGKCKTWKTRPEHFQLPVKYGFYSSGCFYITQENGHEWSLPWREE